MTSTRTEIFKRTAQGWIWRSSLTTPVNPRVDQWLKSPFAQRLINNSVKA